MSYSWGSIDIEYDFGRMKSMLLDHEKRLRAMDKRLQEMAEFVKYVDETAPELRTAFNVAKRME